MNHFDSIDDAMAVIDSAPTGLEVTIDTGLERPRVAVLGPEGVWFPGDEIAGTFYEGYFVEATPWD